jgi:hypothetical protein
MSKPKKNEVWIHSRTKDRYIITDSYAQVKQKDGTWMRGLAYRKMGGPETKYVRTLGNFVTAFQREVQHAASK